MSEPTLEQIGWFRGHQILSERIDALERSQPAKDYTAVPYANIRARAERAERERDEARVLQTNAFNSMCLAIGERDAARASETQLRAYVRHHDTCEFAVMWQATYSRESMRRSPTCTCGLQQALDGGQDA